MTVLITNKLTPREADAVRSIHVILAHSGLPPPRRIEVLRVLAEAELLREDDEDAAFEAVSIASLGVEEELRRAEGGGLTGQQIVRRLGLASQETVRTLRESGRLFAWSKDSRETLRYPAWQVHKGALLPGLHDVLATLEPKKLSPYSLITFFLAPSDSLENRSPLQLLRKDEVETVIAYASRYGDQGG